MIHDWGGFTTPSKSKQSDDGGMHLGIANTEGPAMHCSV
jgi:hypothetical protein